MASANTLAKNISLDGFNKLLSRYSSLLESISSGKALKPGQSSLLELDDFRYNVAVDAFQSDKPKRQMEHDDVKTLVDWKLRHGKFRPTLMKLVSSNDGAVVKKTMQGAMSQYWSDKNIAEAVDAIAQLKGIGPATASLLLSVHDPQRVIFFSDEAFWWLCCDGQKSPIKYNAKEYRQLSVAADEISKRLHVGATDIEKVAYVIMKDDNLQPAASETQPPTNPSTKRGKATNKVAPKAPVKRKSSSVTDTNDSSLRRSQRKKAA
ncbi:hypothetical protein GGR51DRAFT_139694 [Nemania sp. FL0031]|nr:hypothetical protein GGR51DRAFT_139694 [Nemania sp. FL0031]